MRAYIMIVGFSSLALLSGCSSHFDMQGYDPWEYYAEHPVENKVESRVVSYSLAVSPSNGAIGAEEKQHFAQALENVSPVAVEAVMVRMNPKSFYNKTQRARVKSLLKSWGYRDVVRFEPLAELARGEAVVEVTYNAVISPDCPDWRMSPVTTYSNHPTANFGCANTTNLGLMVADPKDLTHGSGTNKTNMERPAKVLSDYRSGAAAAGGSTTTSSASGAGQ